MRLKGAKEWVDEWVDTAQIAWSEVTGLCRFLEGSCDNGSCGAGILIVACSVLEGWSPVYKKCGLVPGCNSLDAELGRRGGRSGMLMDNLSQWIDKCVR